MGHGPGRSGRTLVQTAAAFLSSGFLTATIIVAAFFVAAMPVGALAQECAPGKFEVTVDGAVATFRVEVADTEERRARGLMHRTEMATDEGMLFVYDEAAPVAFWMKDTPLALDIIFFNRRGVACGLAAGTTPFSTDVIPSGCAAQTVLEVRAGVAALNGLRLGAAARHASVLDPVWPCG